LWQASKYKEKQREKTRMRKAFKDFNVAEAVIYNFSSCSLVVSAV